MSNPNPPAFPVALPGHVYGDGSSEPPHIAQEGMTLRDWFAAQALNALVSAEIRYVDDADEISGLSSSVRDWQVVAEDAYAIARLMLRVREA